ncbi:MAG: tRNA (adenosine(37)-N6)-dimethylallyltransferase MiaA [Verrucomicrobiota bacterium]
MSPPFVPCYLAGQTGSGKTEVALAIAERLSPVEIVNADAFQIYRRLDVLSAAPTPLERAVVPHHLFGNLEVSEECDAAAFSKLAHSTIEGIAPRATPLIVGGSGLYLKAITHGLAPTPKGDPELREQLDQWSFDVLVNRYREVDPIGAEQTNLKNRRYVTRNLEICLLTGKPASELKSQWERNQPDICAFYLSRSREDIYERINRRTRAMFEAGVVEEVAGLSVISGTAAKAIGLAEIRALLRGEMSEGNCIEEIQKATRRYAKRQETWFRRESEFVPVPVAPDESADTVAEKILEEAVPRISELRKRSES